MSLLLLKEKSFHEKKLQRVDFVTFVLIVLFVKRLCELNVKKVLGLISTKKRLLLELIISRKEKQSWVIWREIFNIRAIYNRFIRYLNPLKLHNLILDILYFSWNWNSENLSKLDVDILWLQFSNNVYTFYGWS